MDRVQISAESIAEARFNARGVVKHTPITPSAALGGQYGGSIVLKAENLQRTGSFKIRVETCLRNRLR